MLFKSLCYALIAGVMLLPVVTAPIALALGVLFSLTVGNPAPEYSQRISTLLLKACIVGLGFGLPFDVVMKNGAHGLWVSGIGVVTVLLLGLSLGRLFRLNWQPVHLISAGTAICGGSAIAAVGPVIGARQSVLSMSLASVFVLNAAALYLFPFVAHILDLSQRQFALWAALAIHDTSSVLGAAASYGDQALAEATVLKLARAMWIVPLVVGFLMVARREKLISGPVAWPLFVVLFVVASAARSTIPAWQPAFDIVFSLAQRGLVLVLFMIGSGLTLEFLRQIGWRLFGFATVLWLLISALTLAVVVFFPSVAPSAGQ